MNQSESSSQYVLLPPSIPAFEYKHYSISWEKLIRWAKSEFRSRLQYCARHGYLMEFKNIAENSSPIRVLAEMSGFRKMCAKMTPETWKKLDKKDREFLIRAYELRDLLFR